MKQIVVHGKPELKSEAQEVDIPTPNEHQLVIKVVVAGSNPKDWKYPIWLEASNSGDDAAGYVHSVGSAVTEFKVGDRVAIFHEMNTPGGVFAEYAVAWEHTTFHLPKNVSFEEGATIPLAAMTSAIGLFLNLVVRPPLRPATEPSPLLVYGASSAVGAFAIKLAKIANVGPIIGVAGSSSDFAKSIGADAVVDYRNGNVVQDIKDALAKVAPGQKLLHVYDAISEGDSGKHIVQVADDGATITHVLRNAADYETTEKKLNLVATYVADAHHKEDKSRKDFAYAYFRLFGKWLGEGRLTAHPHEVVPGGLDGVIEGLKRLKDNKVNAKKLVFRVADGQ